jgi:hypothetical protein
MEKKKLTRGYRKQMLWKKKYQMIPNIGFRGYQTYRWLTTTGFDSNGAGSVRRAENAIPWDGCA